MKRRPGLMLIIAWVVVGVITPVPTIPTVESETTSESTTAETSEAPTESAETTKSTAAEAAKPTAAEAAKPAAAEAAKPAAAEAAKPTAPETSSAEPPMKTATTTVKSPAAAPGNRLVVGHHQDSGKQRDSTNRPRFPHVTLQLQRRISPKLLLMHT
jgi:hypothetical protein